MKSISILSLAAAVSADALLQPSPATSDPTITSAPQINYELLRKQANNRFMGWVSYSTGWSTRQCDIGGTLYQSGDYWRCCATTVASCNGPVGCISGSLIYAYSTGTLSRRTFACTDVYTEAADRSFTICNTGFMFENTNVAKAQTNVFCGISSVNWSYYRVKPEESSAVVSSATSAATPVSNSAISTSTGLPSPTPLPVNPPTSEKSESKVWIAGAVIGPVVGIAIIGLLAWIFLIKKKKKNAAAAGGPPAMGAAESVPPYNPASPQQGYQPMQQNGAGGFVPFGVSENKHQSWMQPPPGSPMSSPHPQPAAPYYDAVSPNTGTGYFPPPSASPPPQGNTEYYKQPHMGTTQFTSELDASTPPTGAQPVAIQPAVGQAPSAQAPTRNELAG